eukprot:3786503-Amphidinium_carterae.1
MPFLRTPPWHTAAFANTTAPSSHPWNVQQLNLLQMLTHRTASSKIHQQCPAPSGVACKMELGSFWHFPPHPHHSKKQCDVGSVQVIAQQHRTQMLLDAKDRTPVAKPAVPALDKLFPNPLSE